MAYIKTYERKVRVVADLREGERFETERGFYVYAGDCSAWGALNRSGDRDLCRLDASERVFNVQRTAA